MSSRRVFALRHATTGRVVPLDSCTVIGRSEAYYTYGDRDPRADRLRPDVAARLAKLNYITIDKDPGISRVHAVLDPDGPTASDLGSTNGTWVNRERLPGGMGDVGPARPLADADRLRVGRQTFEVAISSVAPADWTKRLRARRRALVACDGDSARGARGARLAHHLSERKGFVAQSVSGWSGASDALEELRSHADAEGIVVVAIVAEVSGSDLRLAGEARHFGAVLERIAALAGRKVVVLDIDGDPTGCERIFEDVAFEDMLLVTSPGEVPLDDSRLAGTIGTGDLAAVRESLSGEQSLRGAFDGAVDGIEALIGADTNVLRVDWVASYRGRLRVVFGARRRGESEPLTHSLRLGTSLFRF